VFEIPEIQRLPRARVPVAELVALALRSIPIDLLECNYLSRLDQNLWEEKDIAMVWMERTGDFFEFFHGCLGDSSDKVRECYLKDKEFVTEAFKSDPGLLINRTHHVGYSWKNFADFDLLHAAFLIDDTLIAKHPSPELIVRFATHLRHRLASSVSFRCFSETTSEADAHGLLPSLNNGSDTAQSLMQHIAEYADVPTSDKVLELEELSLRLSRWGF